LVRVVAASSASCPWSAWWWSVSVVFGDGFSGGFLVDDGVVMDERRDEGAGREGVYGAWVTAGCVVNQADRVGGK
jgi:hypothetical protein